MSTGTPTIKMKSGKEKQTEDRGQNIQVFARCRPLNQAEKNVKAYSIVDIPSHREIVIKEKPNTNLTKSYQFDKVFGPKSQQLDVYRAVVEPLIEQVMMGYNCTVFAYGQTGTGKTFTMEGGERRNEEGLSWDSDPTSGIIPRAMAQIFDNLREQADSVEYSVRVSFLELYNEELFDLLSACDDTSRLRLYEDATRRGSVIIQGLEEVQVHNKAQVYSILEKGSDKRRTAATMMNARSSRSHTVFTVTVHIKEASLEGEEVLRIGKLNLVDLAGSENIGRSGAKDSRAREAGNINQSLLTLGRVISCLVERAPHIPYRESKLTRLLQDSLGGRTKTSIIATVSPATINLEESLSTLDYANRARNITNRPEINQMLSKKEVLKGYSDEMDRLRKDLLTMRDKNGVYLAKENYQGMLDKIEQQQNDITDKAKEMGALKEEMEKKKLLFEEVERCMIEKSREIQKTSEKLESKELKLGKVRETLKKAVREKEEQQHLVTKHMETEGKLGQQARKLVVVNDELDEDLEKLHTKLSTVKDIEVENYSVKFSFMDKLEVMVDDVCQKVDTWGGEHEDGCKQFGSNLKQQLVLRRQRLSSLAEQVEHLLGWQREVRDKMKSNVESNEIDGVNVVVKMDEMVSSTAVIGVEVGNQYLVKVLPQLQQLAGKLQAQARALEHLAVTVEHDLGSVREKVNIASSNIVVAVKETDEMVIKHYEQNCVMVEQLGQVNKEIVASQSIMETSLGVVVQDYKKHKDNVERLGERTSELALDMEEKVGPLVETLVKIQKKINYIATDLVKEITEEAQDVTKKIRGSVEESLGENKGVEEIVRNLESTSDKFENEHAEVWDDLSDNVEKAVVARLDTVEKNDDEIEELVVGVKSKLKANGENFKEHIEEELDTVVGDHLEVLSKKTSDTVDMIQTGMAKLKENVNALLEEDLATYQSSGCTPGRVDRQYPRYLAGTSPHGRILERFRRVVEGDEAARLPLDESVDSVVSEESRASTGVVEERARICSADSMLSSVTSDWDKEEGSQENIFAQPKSKKREIKKPEVFRRNILGSNSSLNSLN